MTEGFSGRLRSLHAFFILASAILQVSPGEGNRSRTVRDSLANGPKCRITNDKRCVKRAESNLNRPAGSQSRWAAAGQGGGRE